MQRELATLIFVMATTGALAAGGGAWSIDNSSSTKSGFVNKTLSLKSNDDVACAWGRGDKIQLQIRCIDGETSVLFVTGCNMIAAENPGYDQVSSQVDDGPTVNSQASETLRNKALGFFDEGQAKNYAKSLYGKSSLTVGMRPFQGEAFKVTFDIRNIEQGIKPVADACNW